MATDHLTKALEFFKDWSNVLLGTTVIALGWIATSSSLEFSSPYFRAACILLFAGAAICGMLTLALIPLVQEARANPGNQATSIYDIYGKFWLFGDRQLPLKSVCFPQHALFILGIAAFAGGTFATAPQRSAGETAPTAEGAATAVPADIPAAVAGDILYFGWVALGAVAVMVLFLFLLSRKSAPSSPTG